MRYIVCFCSLILAKFVNCFTSLSARHTRLDGILVELTIQSDYPFAPAITVRVGCSAPVMMTLCVRIPVWSTRTALRLNGTLLATPPAGDYARLRRVWQTGDVLELQLDFRLRAWVHGTDFIDSAQARVTALPGVVPRGAAPPTAVWSATRDGGWPMGGQLFPGTAAQLLVLDPQACTATHTGMLTLCSVQPSTTHRPLW